jgi:hypothetical protein
MSCHYPICILIFQIVIYFHILCEKLIHMLHDPSRLLFLHMFILVLGVKMKVKTPFANLVSTFRRFAGSKKFVHVVPGLRHLTCYFRCIHFLGERPVKSLSIRLYQLENCRTRIVERFIMGKFGEKLCSFGPNRKNIADCLHQYLYAFSVCFSKRT